MTNWWGNFDFPDGTARRWQIGSLNLFVLRSGGAWFVQAVLAERVMTTNDATGHDGGEHSALPTVVAEQIDWRPTNSATDVVQHLVDDVPSGTPVQLQIRACLPDRPVVSRPREPFVLAPGRRSTLYVAVPVWLQLVEGERAFAEFSTMRFADTWFGPSTVTGELCYASRMHCRTDAAEIEHCVHRAITPLTLINAGKDAWTLDRVALPTPLLPLWRCADDRMWTSALSVRRNEAGTVGDVRASASGPEGMSAEEIAPPRDDGDSSWLGRFYGGLF